MNIQCARDLKRDICLNCKHVVQRTIVSFTPHLLARSTLEETHRDSKLSVGGAHGALQHEPHPEFFANLCGVYVLAAIFSC